MTGQIRLLCLAATLCATFLSPADGLAADAAARSPRPSVTQAQKVQKAQKTSPVQKRSVSKPVARPDRKASRQQTAARSKVSRKAVIAARRSAAQSVRAVAAVVPAAVVQDRASGVRVTDLPLMLERLARVAPGLDRQVLRHALAAMQCAVNSGAQPADRLAVIDYSLPSTARRLWIFDLHSTRLLLQDLVAHGRHSGENLATQFSNIEGSYQSSLGLFRAEETYEGENGYSLRLDGLEPGFNDRARERAIVIHGAEYVSPALANGQGRIGRSQGCPAVRPEVAQMVIDELKGGQFVFSWYPDRRWLNDSAYLNCRPRQVASILARNGG